jgi:hypothetical protein
VVSAELLRESWTWVPVRKLCVYATFDKVVDVTRVLEPETNVLVCGLVACPI